MSDTPFSLKFFRMITRVCGFMGLVQEQCQPFQLVHITAFRGRISSLVVIGKVNSLHKITEILATQIFTILRLVYHWNISHKTLEMGLLVDLKANQSSLSKFGKTATNLVTF